MKNKVSDIFKIMILALLYYISGKICFLVSNENEIVTIVIFTAEGIALAGVILFGRAILPGIFIGQFILAFSSGLEFYPAFAISIVNMTEALIAITLFDKFKLNKSLLTRRDVFGLLLLIVFVLQPFSSIFGNIILLSSSIIDSTQFLKSLFSWWFGNSMGQLLITPFLLYFYSEYKDINKVEFFFIGFFFFLVSYLFIVYFKIPYLPLLTSITMPFLIYLIYKRSLSYAMFSVVIIAFVSILSTTLNIGIFSTIDTVENIILLNFFILFHILLILIIGVLFYENKQEVLINMQQREQLFKSEKMASMGEMIGNIAHHWRQPLSVISTGVTGMQMQKEYGILSDEIFYKTCDTINNNTQLLSKTIDDFTNYMENNDFNEKKEFNLKNAINLFISLENEDIKTHKINIILDLEDITLNNFENELIQCFLNMYNNAKDALVKNDTENKLFFISSKNVGTDTIITMKDNGGGIDESIISKIFEPYFTTKHQSQGTGLGLHIIQDFIVNKCDGTIDVQNVNIDYQGKEYIGVEFIIVLNNNI